MFSSQLDERPANRPSRSFCPLRLYHPDRSGFGLDRANIGAFWWTDHRASTAMEGQGLVCNCNILLAHHLLGGLQRL